MHQKVKECSHMGGHEGKIIFIVIQAVENHIWNGKNVAVTTVTS